MKIFQTRIFFRCFLWTIFLLGLLFYLTPSTNMSTYLQPSNSITGTKGTKRIFGNIESMSNNMIPKCPNLLRQEGDMIMLYDLNQPGSDTNPAVFYNLAEYAQFVKEQQAQGVHCPVLELQTNIVGASISNIPADSKSPMGEEDDPLRLISGDDYFAYNTYGEGNIGKFTKEDEVVNMDEISDNPMDTNWGGVQYSAQMLESGKYDGDRVTKPIYFNGHMVDSSLMPLSSSMAPLSSSMANTPPNYISPEIFQR